ncbi:MAG: hypothetical protein A2295_05435 [Candidatus Jacksonbacteria bacterium RIFOXYB2_FULL_44_15]|nr:MAG: hypothetical protein A2295_05435 [Candidatus Jacksonbacteria bacterium RIFOXYB2_FULL_44_15]OGY80719.1 MAG: hypothetical protein A2550_00605 [Candidatus Jacksonbacteria bacterium RIFOXYD2_FULL_43_21]
MANDKLAKKLIVSLKGFWDKSRVFIYYFNLILIIVVGVWFYLFIERNYFSVQSDVQFIQGNITNISYVELNKTEFDDVYQKYQSKLQAGTSLPPNLKSPF